MSNDINATLKRLYSPDVLDIESFYPKYADFFSILVQAMFGRPDDDGEESFDFIVCSPAWLKQEVETKEIINGLHHIIMKEFNYRKLFEFISSYSITCSGTTWDEFSKKLSRLGKWEFEDYN